MSKAKRIATDVNAAPCDQCGATDEFAQFEKNGQRWLTCSRKIGGQFCNGRPTEDEDTPARGPATTGAGGVPNGSPPFSASPALSDLFEKLSDVAASIAVELRQYHWETPTRHNVTPPENPYADVPPPEEPPF